MDNLEQLEVVQLDGFTPSIPAEPGHEQELASRFNMLFLQPGSTFRGGFGAVAKVVNLYEEVFALKRLNAPDSNNDCSPSELREMLFEEYKNQLAVSRLKGFPQVYGYGSWKGEPLILMEWIEGTTLAHAMPDLPHEGDGVQGEVVAQVGISVLEILKGVERLNSRLVHRDISPNNIMFRTKDMSLSQQVAAGAFDTCLIDFGNSTTECQDIPMAFTQRVGMMRGATRDYAPPEMLTADVEGVEELRNNPAIDIYALCSVLYELYAGHTPFDLTHSLGGSDYRTKMSMDPKPLVARRTYEAPLLNAIMSGIRPSQEARPTVDGLLYELECWYEGRQRNGTVAAPKPVELPNKHDAESNWDETMPVGNAVVVPFTESSPFESAFAAPVAEPATVPMPRAGERFESSRKTPASAPEPTENTWSEPDVHFDASGAEHVPVPTPAPVPTPGAAQSAAGAAAAGAGAASTARAAAGAGAASAAAAAGAAAGSAAAGATAAAGAAAGSAAAGAAAAGATSPRPKRAGGSSAARAPKARAASSSSPVPPPPAPATSAPAPPVPSGFSSSRKKKRGAVSSSGTSIGFRDVRHSRPVRKLGWRLLMILAIMFALSAVSCIARTAFGSELPGPQEISEVQEANGVNDDSQGVAPVEEDVLWQR